MFIIIEILMDQVKKIFDKIDEYRERVNIKIAPENINPYIFFYCWTNGK